MVSTIILNLTSENNQTLKAVVVVGKGRAVIKFTKDPTAAKRLVDYRLSLGHKDIRYDKRNNIAIREFSGLKEKEIVALLRQEAISVGGKESKNGSK